MGQSDGHRKPLRLQLSAYAENPSATLNNGVYPCSLWLVVLHERGMLVLWTRDYIELCKSIFGLVSSVQRFRVVKWLLRCFSVPLCPGRWSPWNHLHLCGNG